MVSRRSRFESVRECL